MVSTTVSRGVSCQVSNEEVMGEITSLLSLEEYYRVDHFGRVPALGGPKSAILGQMSVIRAVFFDRFCVRCSTKSTATDKKHVCNVWSL